MSTDGGLHIGILLFDDADELDAVGPFEVLAAWEEHSASPLRPHVSTFSRDGEGVRLAKGMRIVPARSADDVGPLHVLVHPGGWGTRALVADHGHLEWLRQVHTQTPVVASVCTGALVLAAAGLLAGRPATTHRDYYDDLAQIDPSTVIDTEARFVDDGDVVTSAGASAGIDMALHLVERLESVEVARAVRRTLEYPGI
ncbi:MULTISPECIES: DJ-1/PfpI family protein [unclassified Isoptericola]|uniref:DJ-1/PfpI family protein n=1 Tax=unclassified Isoptericola TaxID=2623355 RepID=UPI0027140B60|nr:MULTISPECIES: DJ-1/PfpI family protein [unclassified Isoptericola]MDO8148861.1 DJ-1/PfpI family protein [Isoptericola sp. b515]MDO8151197.1 DJ-1/PfpI family protein [Isoptericola sp. b408]